ncbi:MAG: urocanate hydratase, partial [Algoriphagus sp.]
MQFQIQIRQGIPSQLPPKKERTAGISHAPKRKDLLTTDEKKLALRNALRYFPKEWHATLAQEFIEELQNYG